MGVVEEEALGRSEARAGEGARHELRLVARQRVDAHPLGDRFVDALPGVERIQGVG